MSWVPALQGPRYVDIRFDPRPTILATRGLAVEVQMLYTGNLRPVISSIEYMLTLPGTPGLIPVPIYTGSAEAEAQQPLTCPGFNVFPIPPTSLVSLGGLSLEGAMVLGVRITLNDGAVEKKTQLPSISAVGLRVARQ